MTGRCSVCGGYNTSTRKVWRSKKSSIRGRVFSVPVRKGEFIGCKDCEHILLFDENRYVVGVATEKAISSVVKSLANMANSNGHNLGKDVLEKMTGRDT